MTTDHGSLIAARTHAARDLRAFTVGADGGNPAGVVLELGGRSSVADMMATAAALGHSETVFVMDGPPSADRREYRVRYFSPQAEVPFCGHATVAVGAALAHAIGEGDLTLHTGAGVVTLRVAKDASGDWTTAVTSPAAQSRPVAPEALAAALATFGWDESVLDRRIAPAEIYAGAWHLLVPVADRSVLAAMTYDFVALRELSIRHGWVTVQAAHMVHQLHHVVRDPFPFGGVVEDPATGAGAAAYAAYLHVVGIVDAPADLEVYQGQDMGVPCLIRVHVPAGGGRVQISGSVAGLPPS